MDVDDMDRVSVSRSKRLIDQNRPAQDAIVNPLDFSNPRNSTVVQMLHLPHKSPVHWLSKFGIQHSPLHQ